MLLLSSADFSKLSFWKKIFQEHYQSVKWFGSRSSPTFCRAWSGSKLLAKVISNQQNLLLAGIELIFLLCKWKILTNGDDSLSWPEWMVCKVEGRLDYSQWCHCSNILNHVCPKSVENWYFFFQNGRRISLNKGVIKVPNIAEKDHIFTKKNIEKRVHFHFKMWKRGTSSFQITTSHFVQKRGLTVAWNEHCYQDPRIQLTCVKWLKNTNKQGDSNSEVIICLY